MYKYVRIDTKQKIIGAYTASVPQKVDKKINNSFNLASVIGLKYINTDTIVAPRVCRIATVADNVVVKVYDGTEFDLDSNNIEIPTDLDIAAGYTYTDGTFSPPPYSIEEHKQQLEQRLHNMAERTIQLTQRKYRLTDATGTATIIRMEYNAWRLDDSTPTPTIDGWAEDKGKTREEQLQAVGYVVTFLEKSAKIQELAWSRMDSATTKEQLDTISSALNIIADCESVLCVLEKAEEVLEFLRDA